MQINLKLDQWLNGVMSFKDISYQELWLPFCFGGA